MSSNSRENPHVIADTSATPDILDSCKEKLAHVQEREHRVKDQKEQIELGISYQKALAAGDDMTNWESTISQRMAARKEEIEEAKKEVEGVKKDLESLILERDGLVMKGTKVTSRSKKVERAKNDSELLRSPQLERDGFEEVSKDKGS